MLLGTALAECGNTEKGLFRKAIVHDFGKAPDIQSSSPLLRSSFIHLPLLTLTSMTFLS